MMVRRTFFLAACLLATTAYVRVVTTTPSAAPHPQLSLLPGTIGNWHSKAAPLDPEVLEELKLDDHVSRQYGREGNIPVTMYVGFHAGLHTGNNIGPHSPLLCLPGLGWQLVDSRQVAVPVWTDVGGPDERPIVVTQAIARNGLDGLVVFFWYDVHGQVVPTETRTKLLLFGDALRGRPSAGALVRLVAPVDLLKLGSHAAGTREATAFMKEMYPLLRQRLASQG